MKKTIITVFMLLIFSYNLKAANQTYNYLINNQKKIEEKMKKKFNTRNYSFDNPMIKVNPYGNSPLSAVIKFKNKGKNNIKVIIDDKIQYVINGSDEIPIIGLRENTKNRVDLEMLNSNNEVIKSKNFILKTKKLDKKFPIIETFEHSKQYSSEDFVLLDIFSAVKTKDTSNFISIVDRQGKIRWAFYNSSYPKILKNRNLMVSLPSKKRLKYDGFMEIDLLGKIYKIYEIKYNIHHDYVELPNENILSLADNSKKDPNYIQDGLIEINRKNGKIEKYIDFKEILDKDRHGMLEWTPENWLHANSLLYIEKDNSILISSRHQSAIIKFSLDTAKIDYIISNPLFWNEKFKSKLFIPDKNLEWTYGNHNASFLKNGNIIVFDNGDYRSLVDIDKTESKDNYSRAVEYKIDLDKMEIEQIWEYGKERGSELYSNYLGSVTELKNGNRLINFGGLVKDQNSNAVDGREYPTIPITYQTSYVVEINPQNNEIEWELRFKDPYKNRKSVNYRVNTIDLISIIEKM